jgi:hypothetical protein
MSAQYYLPCSCGQKVRVEPAQAGGSVTCACGKTLHVPTLRGLKQLELAPHAEGGARQPSRRQWSPIRGAMFSSGLLVLVGSLLVLGYTYLQFTEASAYTEDKTSAINEFEGAQIETMNLMDSLEAFNSLRNEGLGEPVEPFWVTARKIVSQKRNLMIGAVGAALASLIAMVASLVMPAPKTG